MKSDDELQSLFSDSAFRDVHKLFIIDGCYSAGFWGSGGGADSGDLSSLGHSAMLAASYGEGSFGWMREGRSFLSTALISAIAALLENQSDGITFSELFQETQRRGLENEALFVARAGANFGAVLDEGLEYRGPDTSIAPTFRLEQFASDDFYFGQALPTASVSEGSGVGAWSLLAILVDLTVRLAGSWHKRRG